MSREHLVSAGLFTGDVVRVQGFKWCKDSPKEIGLSSFTSKVLCKSHNSELSPVDTAGAAAFAVLREMRRLSNSREKMKPHYWNIVRYIIDGRMLERWLLKTLINLCSSSEYPIGRDATTAGRTTEHFVRVVYGLAPLEPRAGLYFVIRQGMQINSDDSVGFAPLIKDGLRIEGGLFLFRGFNFLLFLEPQGPPEPLTGVYFGGEDLGRMQFNFHSRQINVNTDRFRSQVLTIDWERPT